MKEQFNIQHLEISKTGLCETFFDINPIGNNLKKLKTTIFIVKKTCYIDKCDYHVDLGWYGKDDLANEATGYCIHLYRGNDWNNGELLENIGKG
ncbi:MAG: hypothetical protein IPL95_16770 [Saprospiraceae bacterium]|nr:hypothetical protein [Saprospiraceae bacterium]